MTAIAAPSHVEPARLPAACRSAHGSCNTNRRVADGTTVVAYADRQISRICPLSGAARSPMSVGELQVTSSSLHSGRFALRSLRVGPLSHSLLPFCRRFRWVRQHAVVVEVNHDNLVIVNDDMVSLRDNIVILQ